MATDRPFSRITAWQGFGLSPVIRAVAVAIQSNLRHCMNGSKLLEFLLYVY